MMNIDTFKGRFEALLHTALRKYHGFTEIEANNEVYYVSAFIGIDKLKEGTDLKFANRAYVFPEYPRYRRDIGVIKPLNRKERVSIALSINNALNHAEFPVRVKPAV